MGGYGWSLNKLDSYNDNWHVKGPGHFFGVKPSLEEGWRMYSWVEVDDQTLFSEVFTCSPFSQALVENDQTRKKLHGRSGVYVSREKKGHFTVRLWKHGCSPWKRFYQGNSPVLFFLTCCFINMLALFRRRVAFCLLCADFVQNISLHLCNGKHNPFVLLQEFDCCCLTLQPCRNAVVT